MAHGDDGPRGLLFVFNTDAGLLAALADAAHRACTPDTFHCRLSTLIRASPFGPPGRWVKFIGSLGVPVRFVHRREFLAEQGDREVALPALFEQQGRRLVLRADAAAIQAAATLDDLEQITLTALRPERESLRQQASAPSG